MAKRGRGRPVTSTRTLQLRGSWRAKLKQQPPLSGTALAYENYKAAVLASGFSLEQAHQLISGSGDVRGFGEPECSRIETLYRGTPQEYSSKISWYSDEQLKAMLKAWAKLKHIIFAWLFTENLHCVPCAWPTLLPAAWWMFESPERRNESITEGQQTEQMNFTGTVERLYEPYVKAMPNPQAAREILECQFEVRYATTQADK